MTIIILERSAIRYAVLEMINSAISPAVQLANEFAYLDGTENTAQNVSDGLSYITIELETNQSIWTY